MTRTNRNIIIHRICLIIFAESEIVELKSQVYSTDPATDTAIRRMIKDPAICSQITDANSIHLPSPMNLHHPSPASSNSAAAFLSLTLIIIECVSRSCLQPALNSNRITVFHHYEMHTGKTTK